MAIFGGYTGARISPLPSGFMAAAQSSATNLQKGLASLGEGVAAGLKQYGKNKDERDLLEGDVDAIKNIVESDPARYADIARDETNIKKFGEVPDMSLSKLRAYSTSLRTQMAAVDRRDAQSIQDLQRQKLQSEADDRKGFQAAMGIVPKVDPVMQTQYGEKTVLPIPQGEYIPGRSYGRELGMEAAWNPTGFQEKVLTPGVPIVSEGQDTASRKDIREFYGGMADQVLPGVAEAIGRFGEGVKKQFFDPAVGMGKSLGALAQVPGAPALEGYFQPEHETIRATGPGGAPTPDDIARLADRRSQRARMKADLIPQWQIDEQAPPLKVEETPLYVPREKGDAPGTMIQRDGINTRTGLPDLTRYAGQTSNLRLPEEALLLSQQSEDMVPTGYWTGLAQRGEMPNDPYTITADGEKTMMQMMSLEDTQGWSSVERLLELNPHLPFWYDSTGRPQPGNKEGDWVPPAGMKILIPNEVTEIDANTGQPINVSRYRDPNAPLTDEEKAAKVRDQITALVPTSGTPWERIRGLGANLAEQGRQDQAALEAEMSAPVHTFPFEQRQTSKEVQVGERDVTWKDAHARMIQHLVDNKQQITPALSKSLEDFAKTQYAAEEVGITTKPIPGTDDVWVFDKEGKPLGKSTKPRGIGGVAWPVTTMVKGEDGKMVEVRTGKLQLANGTTVDDPVPLPGDVADIDTPDAVFESNAVEYINQIKLLKDTVEEYGTYENAWLGNEPAAARFEQIPYKLAILYAKMVDPATAAREGEVEAAKKYVIKLGALSKKGAVMTMIEDQVAEIRRRAGIHSGRTGREIPGWAEAIGMYDGTAGVGTGRDTGTSRDYTNDPRLNSNR